MIEKYQIITCLMFWEMRDPPVKKGQNTKQVSQRS